MKQQKIIPFAYPAHQLKKCGLILCSILIALMFASAATAVTGLTMSPEQPVVGDEIVFTGQGAPNSVLEAHTSYTVEVPVENGAYAYELKNIKVPEGTSTFAVEAEKVDNLEVTVKKFGIPYSRSANADANGLAKISQPNVLPFTYKVSISGQAAETETVNLTLQGTSMIETDADGYFECSYKTTGVPAGLFIVNIDGSETTIEILEKKAAKAINEKTSGKTGTELKIVPVSQGPGDQQDGTEDGSETIEAELATTPENLTPAEENISNPSDIQQEPQPGTVQKIMNWLKGLFIR